MRKYGTSTDSVGADRIVQERNRQIDVVGYRPDRDAVHTDGELALAAACYLRANDDLQTSIPNTIATLRAAYKSIPVAPETGGVRQGLTALILQYEADPTELISSKGWPWEQSGFKPSTDPIRNLEKAGALLAAEIDRLRLNDPERLAE